MTHLDGAMPNAAEQRYGFTSLCMFADIGANPVELAEYLDQGPREQTYADGENLDPAFVEVAHAAGTRTFDELADKMGVARVFAAEPGAVTVLMNHLGCRRTTDDEGRHWCIEHGSYNDHEPWTRHGCASARRVADLVIGSASALTTAAPAAPVEADLAEEAPVEPVVPRFTEIDNGWLYLPEGLPRDHPEVRHLHVMVDYKGTYPNRRTGGEPVDWYSVEHEGSQLSRAGTWGYSIQRFQTQQYRFTLDEAREWAARVVNDVTANGRTWAQWQAHWSSTDTGTQG